MLFCAVLCSLLFPAVLCRAAEGGESVVVVFNSRLKESRAVAEHYAARRGVPTNQLIGLELSEKEEITRKDFQETLERPLRAALVQRGIWSVAAEPRALPHGRSGRSVTSSKIRHAALCFGVPLKIQEDGSLKESEADKLPAELRRNDAAVDSELALLPLGEGGHPLVGAFANPSFGTTNRFALHPTNGILLVARLDGPTAEIARGLVDKAIETESNGFWGRAYFDLRGLTNGDYAIGDQWIARAADVARRRGFETDVDRRAETLPAGFPLAQCALYAGWYDGDVSGPFAREKVEFMPGAFAYHLHSFSAATLRSTTRHWCGPLLARGATCTMGSVYEPFLAGTPDVGAFLAALLMGGHTFGEAACIAQRTLSWQTTVVGDPLYQPARRHPEALFTEHTARGGPRAAWAQLFLVNANLAAGVPPGDIQAYLAAQPLARGSSLLREKQAALYLGAAKYSDAFEFWGLALRQETTPGQRATILLTFADKLAELGRDEEALTRLEQLLKECPAQITPSAIHARCAALAEKLGRKEEAEKHRAAAGK